MKIYTKTGDMGTTSDVLGQRVSKGDIKIELQGSIDEVNGGVGFLRALLANTDFCGSSIDIDKSLRDIQYALFRIGGDVSSDFSQNYINKSDIEQMEESIDIMSNATGPLESFIYYSGSKGASYCHIVRSVTRRAERVFVRYMEGKDFNLDYQYINRLSDYLFSMSRYLNFLEQIPDEAMKLK